MEENGFLHAKPFRCGGDDVAGSCHSCLSMANGAAALESGIVEPIIHQGEFLTAMVNLSVIEPDRLAIVEYRDVRISSIADAC